MLCENTRALFCLFFVVLVVGGGGDVECVCVLVLHVNEQISEISLFPILCRAGPLEAQGHAGKRCSKQL